MSLLALINYILVVIAGTVITSLVLVCIDDWYPSQRKPEWVRWVQAFFISLCAVGAFMAMTSQWLAELAYNLENTKVF